MRTMFAIRLLQWDGTAHSLTLKESFDAFLIALSRFGWLEGAGFQIGRVEAASREEAYDKIAKGAWTFVEISETRACDQSSTPNIPVPYVRKVAEDLKMDLVMIVGGGRDTDGQRTLHAASYGREGQHKDEAATWADALESLLSSKVERRQISDFRKPTEAALNAEGLATSLLLLKELAGQTKLSAGQQEIYAALLEDHGRRVL